MNKILELFGWIIHEHPLASAVFVGAVFGIGLGLLGAH
jgi:hypothetical protein